MENYAIRCIEDVVNINLKEVVNLDNYKISKEEFDTFLEEYSMKNHMDVNTVAMSIISRHIRYQEEKIDEKDCLLEYGIDARRTKEDLENERRERNFCFYNNKEFKPRRARGLNPIQAENLSSMKSNETRIVTDYLILAIKNELIALANKFYISNEDIRDYYLQLISDASTKEMLEEISLMISKETYKKDKQMLYFINSVEDSESLKLFGDITKTNSESISHTTNNKVRRYLPNGKVHR